MNTLPLTLTSQLHRTLASEKTQKAIDTLIWVVVLGFVATAAMATSGATTGTAVTSSGGAAGESQMLGIVNWIKGSTEGSMGNVFALGTLAVGLATGIVRQTLMPVAVAVGMAATAKWGPAILLGITGTVI